MKSKILISQGQGRLHFTETCTSLAEAGVEIDTLTGWVPKYFPTVLIDSIGRLFGKANLSKRLALRRLDMLGEKHVISCVKPELLLYFMLILSRFKIVSEDQALTIGWRYWGEYSKKYLKAYEIFHCRSGAGQGGAIIKARKNGLKVLVDHSIAHPLAIEKYVKEHYFRFGLAFDLNPRSEFWQLVLKDCEEADYLLVNSQFVADTFLEYGYPKSKIKIAYLGVREDFFNLKKDWSIIDVPRLLFTGNFSIRKGCVNIIEALNILTKEGFDVMLDVVGHYNEIGAIQKTIDIPSNIIFHGNILQDDLKDFLIKSDIYVFPTLAEGSARSAMEAMAAGLPVITTPNCGSPIEDKVSGIIISVNDSKELAYQIKSLLSNKELRRSIGENASSLISCDYKWSNYAENVKQIYLEVV